MTTEQDGPTILVVEDDQEVARTLTDILAHHGLRSELAGSGEEALEKLGRGHLDLVLLDVRLPGIDGFATCARIREALGPSLPVLILTAYPDPEAVRSGYGAGADDFVAKPFRTDTLIPKVRALLRLKALHDGAVRHRQEAQARVRDLALLHEIGRDWSLIAEPGEFNRMVTGRLAALIGAPVCLVAQFDPATRVMAASLPVHGLDDETARSLRYVVRPEHRSLWSFRSGRPYLSNRPLGDPHLVQEMVQKAGVESVVLVPMLSGGSFQGVLVAINKPSGFTDADVQLLTVFAGPAATFLHGRALFASQRRQLLRLERIAALTGEMAATLGRGPLLGLTVSRLQADLGYDRVAFLVRGADGGFVAEAVAGASAAARDDAELLRWVAGGARALQGSDEEGASLAVPVGADGRSLGILHLRRERGRSFPAEEVALLATLAGQLALALQRSESVARVERMARQLSTLYDLGLETGALRDLPRLFATATAEAGRLIRADHTLALKLDAEGILRPFASWARVPEPSPVPEPSFRIGEGVAGQVARDGVPALVNDPATYPGFVHLQRELGRLICVPLAGQGDGAPGVVGVLNATRVPGGEPFTADDVEYLRRFAGQLSIAVANSMAFEAERERSEQLALVNALLREIAGKLSRQAILETAVRRIREAFRHPVVTIVVPDPEAGVGRVVAVAADQPPPEGWPHHPLGSGLLGRVFRERHPVVVPDVAEVPDSSPTVASTRSEAVVPIFSGDELTALLDVQSDRRAAFGRSALVTLETLADGIGIALRNADLYGTLERTNARLVELDRTRGELLNMVAHDFRSPLAAVAGYAELLEWKVDAPRAELTACARSITEAATHLTALVDKTLKTNRLETGQLPFDFRVTDLVAVVRQVLARTPDDAAHPVQVEAPEDPLPVWGDPERLAEVMDNLVSNAVKYSPEGGPVLVEVERAGDTARVRVTDAGIGLGRGDLERLFKPFSRVRNDRTEGIPGSGLGLYICDRILRAHGGRIAGSARPGEGSTFSFSLPVFGVSAQTRPSLVLVAVPDEGTRREVHRVAERLGFASEEVGDGVEALETALRLRPAAVVADRVLPRLGAEDLAARLREAPGTRRTAVIVLARDGELSREAEAGFAACLRKPLDPKSLSDALDRLGHPGSGLTPTRGGA